MSAELKNKVAVVTGGNSGIGLATAEKFVAAGAKTVIVGRNRETLDQAVAALGENASAKQADVSDTGALQTAFAAIAERHGKIDVLFVNAGVAEFSPITNVGEDHFDRLFGINVKGAYFTIQTALDYIADGGSIVLTTSVVNEIGLPGSSVYSATKAALRSFVRTLAAELAPRGIRVNAVAPGLTETPLVEKLGLAPEEI
ncbi:MAG: SDR family NAD(P)-dependent oxidoreductase, partial [Pseudomonadota bacterium]